MESWFWMVRFNCWEIFVLIKNEWDEEGEQYVNGTLNEEKQENFVQWNDICIEGRYHILVIINHQNHKLLIIFLFLVLFLHLLILLLNLNNHILVCK